LIGMLFGRGALRFLRFSRIFSAGANPAGR